MDLTAATLTACDDALAKEGSIGLISAEARIPALRTALEAAGVSCLAPGEETSAEARLTLVPATLAKGLEYDYVVLDEAGRDRRRRTGRTHRAAPPVRLPDPAGVRADGGPCGGTAGAADRPLRDRGVPGTAGGRLMPRRQATLAQIMVLPSYTFHE